MKNNLFRLIASVSILCGSSALGGELHDLAQRLKLERQNAGHADSNETLTIVNCGDVVTSSIRIANDLNCPDSTGFALSVSGDNVVINGNGKTIFAPNASAGIFVQGNNDSITNLKVIGVAQGYGVFAYDAPGLLLNQNEFSSNSIGMEIYAENTVSNHVAIYNNKSVRNSQFGIRFSQDGNGSVLDPLIFANDFSNSGSYAMYIQATRDTLGDLEFNDLSNSLNGIYLKTGDFIVHDLDLSIFKIPNTALFVDNAASVKIKNMDVSSHLAPTAMQQNIGIDLYQVGSFKISGLISEHNDVGLKLSTEQGISTEGKVKDSLFRNNHFAGIMITSFDSTPYGVLDLSSDSNRFQEANASMNVFTSPGTVWSAPVCP